MHNAYIPDTMNKFWAQVWLKTWFGLFFFDYSTNSLIKQVVQIILGHQLPVQCEENTILFISLKKPSIMEPGEPIKIISRGGCQLWWMLQCSWSFSTQSQRRGAASVFQFLLHRGAGAKNKGKQGHTVNGVGSQGNRNAKPVLFLQLRDSQILSPP